MPADLNVQDTASKIVIFQIWDKCTSRYIYGALYSKIQLDYSNVLRETVVELVALARSSQSTCSGKNLV